MAVAVGNSGQHRIAAMAWRRAGGSPGAGRGGTSAVPVAGSSKSPSRQALTVRVVVVLEDAIGDIERARDFYNGIQPGIGEYFVDSLLTDIERLAHYHGIHAKRFGFHRMLSVRFPFAIYYRDTSGRTEVFAVLDVRHDPAWLGKQMRDRGSGDPGI